MLLTIHDDRISKYYAVNL